MSLYLYLHVYKTAGMTMRKLLRQWLTKQEYDEVDTPDWQTGLDRIKCATGESLANRKCLFGHLWYGWHSFVARPSQYVTLLREPQSRVLSLYWYHRTTSSHPDYQLASQLGFSDYVQERHPSWMDNGQVRQIAGLLDDSGQHLVGFGGVTKEHLEAAKANLRNHFEFVGLQERFPEAVVAVADLLGQEPTPYVTRNKTRNKPDRPYLSDSDLATINSINDHDAELYEFAKALYYERHHRPSLRRRARDLEALSKKTAGAEGDSIYNYR